MICISIFAVLPLFTAARAQAPVSSVNELREAVARAKPGARILIAPGQYEGGVTLQQIHGEASKRIVISGSDPAKLPVFKGGNAGIHLSNVEYVDLKNIQIEGCADNGLNIDDGGSIERPSHHISLENIKVSRIGAAGNQDGIKLSGIDDFTVSSCSVEYWGTGGGSAIDMVGCHRGVVENSTFIHTENGGTGIQMKGGSSDVAIRANRFENAGSRAVNIGGSTGSPYFRPALKAAPFAEARNITVERNTFIGSQCPVAFVGVDGAVVRFNTIFAPGKWAIRILQETTDEGFIHCRNGKFMDNIVVFDSAHWGEGGVNIGPATEASTFEFARNFWYCIDSPGRSRPTLPTKEKDGVHGIDPKFRDVTKRDFRLMPDSPARDYGADAPGSVTTKPRRY